MTQQEQPNPQLETVLPIRTESNREAKQERVNNTGREWFPEDDDEWYEPDYCRSDRTS